MTDSFVNLIKTKFKIDIKLTILIFHALLKVKLQNHQIKSNKMNKKNITIDTQFFNEEFDQSLNSYITQQIDPNYMHSHIKETLFKTKDKQSSLKESFQNISQSDYKQRYQYIPENQYSRDSTLYKENSIRPQSKAARQMQGANQIQKLLSQAMANAFINCWDTLKGLLVDDNQINNQSYDGKSYHITDGKSYHITDGKSYHITDGKSYQQQHFVEMASNNKKANMQGIVDPSMNNSRRAKSSQLNLHEAQNQLGGKSQKPGFSNSEGTKNQNSERMKNQNSERMKNQIMQRQRKGITLDSLQRKKNSRQKSFKKEQVTTKLQHNLISNDSNRLNEGKRLNDDSHANNENSAENYREEVIISAENDLSKSNKSAGSKKSYRQKFQQYKHQAKLNGPSVIQNSYKKSANHSKIQSYNLNQQNNSYLHYNRFMNNPNTSIYHQRGRYGVQNNTVHQNNSYRNGSSYNGQKNELLTNINKILQKKDSQRFRNYDQPQQKTTNNYNLGNDIRAKDYMDNISTIHNHNLNTLRNLSYSFHPTNTHVLHNQQNHLRYYHPMSKPQLHIDHDQQQFARARLLEQIVDKLHYSKLKYKSQGHSNSSQEAQMVKKLGKLQKLVLQLKIQNEKASRIKSEYEAKESRPKRDYNSEYISRQEDELFRKFTDQLYTIRSQLALIKNSRPTSQYNGNEKIVIQQQKLLNSFQQSLSRLQKIQQSNKLSQRPSITQQPSKTSNPQAQGSGSFLNELIEVNKNKLSKQGWNQGWQETQKVTDLNKLSRRQIQLRARDNLTNYRYTRNQILLDIGKKQQIDQEQRWLLQQQQRWLLQQQQRLRYLEQPKSTRIRKMEDLDEELIIKARPIRQVYQKQWQQYQKNKIDVDYGKNGCCSLFPC